MKYCVVNCKTWSVLCRPRKGVGVSQIRRYRQSYDDIDEFLEILKIATEKRAEVELEALRRYVSPKEARDWEVVPAEDLPPF